MEDKIKNQDIIDFRYELIDKMCSKTYPFGGLRNTMTEDHKKVLNDVLVMFNNHFGIRGYDIG